MNVGSCQQLSCICSDSSTNLVILINLISARLSLNLSANGAWWLVPISLQGAAGCASHPGSQKEGVLTQVMGAVDVSLQQGIRHA